MKFRLFTIIFFIVLSGCSTISRKAAEPYGYKYDVYTVRQDEDISYISEQFGIPANIILALNSRSQNADVLPGERLKIPFYNEVFPVKITDEDWIEECSALRDGYPRILWPVIGAKVSSKYGPRWGRFHQGVDLRAPESIPVFAAHTGRVIKADDSMSGYGNLMVIEGRGLRTYYAHQSAFFAEYGEVVRQGDLIGYVGSTGHVTGPHLHFESRAYNGQKYALINPLCYFRK